MMYTRRGAERYNNWTHWDTLGIGIGVGMIIGWIIAGVI